MNWSASAEWTPTSCPRVPIFFIYGFNNHYCRITLVRALPLAHEDKHPIKRIDMRIKDHKLTEEDYPSLAQSGFIIFRKKPEMTRGKLERTLRRQERTRALYGYDPLPTQKPDGSPMQRCAGCNNCLITGLSDGRRFQPFSHWCMSCGAPVEPEAGCPHGRGKWGSVIQVLRGRTTAPIETV